MFPAKVVVLAVGCEMSATIKISVGLALALALAACQKPASNATPPPVVTNTAPAAAAPATPTAAATGSDAADAKAFLDGLYAHYKTSKDNTFAPFDANQAEVLDPDTMALMKADDKALNGELGDIDGDWLCDCQDFQSITATVTVQSATPTSAKATADFHDVIDTDSKPKHDTFDLVKTPAGWRIHDMGTADQPSLRKVLQDEITRMKAGGKPTGGGD
jgi:hypothetical protein